MGNDSRTHHRGPLLKPCRRTRSRHEHLASEPPAAGHSCRRQFAPSARPESYGSLAQAGPPTSLAAGECEDFTEYADRDVIIENHLRSRYDAGPTPTSAKRSGPKAVSTQASSVTGPQIADEAWTGRRPSVTAVFSATHRPALVPFRSPSAGGGSRPHCGYAVDTPRSAIPSRMTRRGTSKAGRAPSGPGPTHGLGQRRSRLRLRDGRWFENFIANCP
jgi:hypothetical protein